MSEKVKNVVPLEYNNPIIIKKFETATIKDTYQVNSCLMLINESGDFDVSYFIEPDPGGEGQYTLKATDDDPIIIVHNWEGSDLKIANISKDDVPLKIFLT